MTPDPRSESACARVRGRLDELLDGGLAPLETARDQGHLEACAPCAAARDLRAAWLEAVRRALAPAPGLGARADAALGAALAGEALPRGPERRGGRRLAGAALLAAAALLALALLPALPGGESAVRAWGEASLAHLAPRSVELSWPVSPPGPWGAR